MYFIYVLYRCNTVNIYFNVRPMKMKQLLIFEKHLLTSNNWVYKSSSLSRLNTHTHTHTHTPTHTHTQTVGLRTTPTLFHCCLIFHFHSYLHSNALSKLETGTPLSSSCLCLTKLLNKYEQITITKLQIKLLSNNSQNLR